MINKETYSYYIKKNKKAKTTSKKDIKQKEVNLSSTIMKIININLKNIKHNKIVHIKLSKMVQ